MRNRQTDSFMISACRLIFLGLLFAPGCPVVAADDVYVLRRGDTLYSIARKFDVPLQEILEANHIQDPSNLKVGTRIRIPGEEGGYTVRKGDTLYGIARRHGLTVAELRRLNDLPPNHVLRVGTNLHVPSLGAGETAEPVTPVAGQPFWPHPGPVQPLEGRLANAVGIDGQAGDPVVSVSAGRVTWAAPFRGYGKIVFVKSENGVTFGYAGHDELTVSVGDQVQIGSTLGTLGVNARDGVARLYFFATRGNTPLDPYKAPRN
jgi:murein DD-endopeptidase MepM/ murein hydrolase activator NlpD